LQQETDWQRSIGIPTLPVKYSRKTNITYVQACNTHSKSIANNIAEKQLRE